VFCQIYQLQSFPGLLDLARITDHCQPKKPMNLALSEIFFSVIHKKGGRQGMPERKDTKKGRGDTALMREAGVVTASEMLKRSNFF
jgi:hypothetical protein